MKIFEYSGVRAKSLRELSVAQKVQIVHFFKYEFYSDEEITIKHVKRFSCTAKVLEKLRGMDLADVVSTKSSSYNPRWSGENYIFHPEPDPEEFTFFEPNYDPVNVGDHIEWTESDAQKFFAGCLETALETLRDSKLGSKEDNFTNAMMYIRSDVNKLYCQHIGIDHEELCSLAIHYKEQHDAYNASKRNSKAVKPQIADDVEIESELIDADEFDYISLIDEQETN